MSTPPVGTVPGQTGGAPTSAPSPGTRPWKTGPKKGKAAPAAKGKGAVRTTAASIPKPTLRPPRSAVGGKDWAGFALGLVLHALVVSYIRYGKAGPKGWMKAKFLNSPIQGDDLESQNRKDANGGVDPKPSGRGPNGEIPAEGHMDENTEIM